jgi:DNA-binding LytR/AlgR family response regulator
MRVVLADDEQLGRQRVERLLQASPGVHLVGSCASGDEVLEVVRNQAVDLVLLDIQMPGLTGLDVSALLGDSGPAVVFVTAHPEHALQAFGLGAVDYLLKPVDAGQLQKALERVRKRLPAQLPLGGPLALQTPRGVRMVVPDDITHALLDETAVEVHTAAGRFYVDTSLQDLERRLPADRFLRIHRRALVNLSQVALFEPVDSGGYLARLKSGESVAVSRQAARALRRRFGMTRQAGDHDEG